MRIAVLHNQVSDEALPDEQDNLVQLEEVTQALTSLGHETHAVPCPLDLGEVVRRLRAVSPDIVFNLVESIEGSGRLIHFATSLLESLGFRYTGCHADAFYLTSNKLLAKEILRLNGIPTPQWVTAERLRSGQLVPLGKMIVKSVWEHASIGLDESSLIESEDSEQMICELSERAAGLGGSNFAEIFIDGREFNLSVLETDDGPVVLPSAEMCFDSYPDGKPKIVGYEAKWSPYSFEYTHTVRRFDFPAEDRKILQLLCELALKCWDTFALRGYARVDFRVDRNGRPYVLEINANPCISSDAGFAAAATRHGMSYEQIIGAILRAAQGPPRAHMKRAAAASADTPLGFRNYVTPDDRAPLEQMIRGTGFFTEAEVEVAMELIDAYIEKGEKSGYCFLVRDFGEGIEGYTCYGQIPCTRSSWDLYWIVVRNDLQRQKLGSGLLVETERWIANLGGTLLYIDTSARPLYNPTRLFYQRNGYVERAFLKDFYTPGDGKFIFVKELKEPV
jgi:D-alanine-D-alanine ligase